MEVALKSPGDLFKKYRNLVILVLLVIFILPVIWSLFQSGFFVSDDGEWMIIRFSAFHQALRDGQFPVRWLGRLNHGYGYPVANFLYPGFMYLAEIPKILGFSFVSSIKIVLGLSLVFSGVFFYFWLSKIFGRLPSFIGALFYVYAPYHLYDAYTRGSVGEVLALAIIPFILWQVERKSLFWSTLGTGILIISHNTLALLFLPLIVLYLLLDIFITERKNRLHIVYSAVLILILSLGLSAFFWLPSIFDLQYTVFFQTSVSQWNEYFADQKLVGLPTIVIFVLFFILFLVPRIKPPKDKLTIFLFALGVLSLFFSLPLSAPLWELLPVSFFQFPFRFLSVTILCASFLTACFISALPSKLKVIVGALIWLLILISAEPFMLPFRYLDKGEGFYTTNEDTTTVRSEYMPRWVKTFPAKRPNQKIEIVKGEGEIRDQAFNSQGASFSVDLKSNSSVQVNTVYFPGWQAWVDGEKRAISYENDRGLIQIPLQKGRHEVLVKFNETPLRLFSDIISLISFLTLIGLAVKKYSSKKS